VLALLLFACACGSSAQQQAPAAPDDFASMAPHVGDPAPDFALRDLDGATVRLSDATARGPVVLVFGSFS
jgi:hypothetical protein